MGSKEKARYKDIEKEKERLTTEIAEKEVPKSIDIALLGGGWPFFSNLVR